VIPGVPAPDLADVPPETSPSGPFTDTAATAALYATPDRLTRRTRALHAARLAGRPADQVIADLAAAAVAPGGVVADIGCGRGTTTLALAARLTPRVLLAVDRAPALLAVARARFGGAAVRPICADLHRLPVPDRALDLAVAAFCLYHSPRPADAVAELARCLLPGGIAILASKSADSYHELDHLVAASGVDPHAASRPSLYATANSGNLAALAGTALQVTRVVHEPHRFRFADLAHAAAYLATSPKYPLPAALQGRPNALAAALRERVPDGPVDATSTVTYVLARRPATTRSRR